MTSAISVESLSKLYRVYSDPRELLIELVRGKKRHRDFYALNDVSFSIEHGAVVGIIGRNGAGKSTLLKILTGTLDPTAGKVVANGRISAILELGSGFNPDYSGRENIYLGGLCLGLTRKEINGRIDSIIGFSELEEFIDQPFRTYSSGMQARLTFSVAVSVDPDILIVDEALSVGDARFQRKCFRRFEEFKAAGCTILFVTHQTGVVESICDRAIYLNEGRISADGPPKEVVAQYMQDIFGPSETGTAKAPPIANNAPLNHERRYGTEEALIVEFGVLDSNGRQCSFLSSGQPFTIFCNVQCNCDALSDLQVGISISTTNGVRLVASNSILHQVSLPPLERGQVVQVKLEGNLNLGLGDYFITFGAWSLFSDKHYDRRVDALHLIVRGAPNLSQSLVNIQPRYTAALIEG